MNALDIEKLSRQIQLNTDDREEGVDSSSSADENELMDELQELCGSEEEVEPAPSRVLPQQLSALLTSRIQMYRSAISSASGPKKRRYERAITTLNSQLKQANSGHHVDEEEIPPEIKIHQNTTSRQLPADAQPPAITQLPPASSTAKPETSKIQSPVVTPATAGQPELSVFLFDSLLSVYLAAHYGNTEAEPLFS